MFTVLPFDLAPGFTLTQFREAIEAKLLELPSVTLHDAYDNGGGEYYRVFKLLPSGTHANRLFVRLTFTTYGYVQAEMLDGWDNVNHSGTKISQAFGFAYLSGNSIGVTGFVAKSTDGSLVTSLKQSNNYLFGVAKIDVANPIWDTNTYMPYAATSDFGGFYLIQGTNKNPWGNTNYLGYIISANRPSNLDPVSGKRLLLTDYPIVSEVTFWGYLTTEIGRVNTAAASSNPGDEFTDGVTTEKWLQIDTSSWMATCIKVAN